MLRSFKRFWVLALLASSIIWAGAFSLLGPVDTAYQTQSIGYNLVGDGGGGPMNLGEEYRWTVPVITYGFDQSFLDYFGSNGVRAVEQAIAILNGTNIFQNYTNLTALIGPYSAMSPDLSEFPQTSQRVHLQARALGLLDLKSTTLAVVLEQLGLADPERFAWTLRLRDVQPTFTNYVVIQRNFDPVTSEPSSYVNGTLFTYRIFDPLVQVVNYADAVEFPADPDAFVNTPVVGGASGGLLTGGYYTGLTRDDVGGLRYLYRKENRNVERLQSDIDLAVTNTTPTNLTLFDLTLFLNRTALGTTNGTTNTPIQLLALYPGLIITSNNVRLANVTVTNISSYFTNFPVGPPTRVSVTNFTTNIVTVFDYAFGNIRTNSYSPTSQVTDQTVTVTLNDNFVPGLGAFVTNVTSTSYTTNIPSGDFYIIPANLLDFYIGSTQVVQLVMSTNIVSSDFGNLFAFTNRSEMVPVFTQDLALLTQRSYGMTNNGNAIRALYPGILITHTNTRLTNMLVINFVGANAFLSNQLTRVFDYQYGNVVTNFRAAIPTVTRQTVEIVPAGPGGSPGGSLRVTNVISSTRVLDINFSTTNFSSSVTTTGLTTNSIGVTTNFSIGVTTNFSTVGVATNFSLGVATNFSIRVGTNVLVGVTTNASGISVTPNFATKVVTTSTTNVVTTSTTNEVTRSSAKVVTAYLNVQGEFFIVPTNSFLNPGVGLLGYVNALNEPDFTFTSDALFVNEATSITNLVFTNTTAVYTNRAVPFSLATTNLHLFTQRARTNTTAAFLAFYPGVLISQTNTTFGINVTPVVTTYLTNFPWSPIGVLTLASNVTFLTNVITLFDYTFANVVTNNYFGNTPTNAPYTSGFVTQQGFTVTQDPFAPFGSLGRTNYFSSTTVATTNSDGTPFIDGQVYVVPPNLFGYDIVATQLVTLEFSTNVIFTSTITNNNVVVTNARTELVTYSTNYFFTAYPIEFLNPTNVGVTGFGRRDELVRSTTTRVFAAYEIQLLTAPGSDGPGLGTRHEIITFSTNSILTVFPIVFQNQTANNLAPTLRQGVDKITFQRVNFDSLLGQVFLPVTNIFPAQYVVTNSQVVTQYLRRVITQPDILFLAEDIGFFIGGSPIAVTRPPASSWTNNNGINGLNNLAGPGVITPQKRFTFNKVGATLINRANSPFLDETTAFRNFVWGSFDGSTNAPIIYPAGTSIQALEQQVLTGP